MDLCRKNELTAPCGLDCFNCFLFEENITEEIISKMTEKLNLSKEEIVCKGCRQQGGCSFLSTECATLKCVHEKEVEFCFECDSFPCEKLQPVADCADKYPHNFKLYNLCRIKNIGLDKWFDEAADIRKKYFMGKFVVGMGPIEE